MLLYQGHQNNTLPKIFAIYRIQCVDGGPIYGVWTGDKTPTWMYGAYKGHSLSSFGSFAARSFRVSLLIHTNP